MILHLLLSSMLVAMATGEAPDWSFQTLLGASFSFYCNDTDLAVESGAEFVTWRTPSKAILASGLDNDLYKVNDKNDVKGIELQVKIAKADTHGIYECIVHDKTTAVRRGSLLRGLNVYDHLYESLTDKYTYNIKVAFISAAVFLVPVATIMLVYQFQYRPPEYRIKKMQKKKGVYEVEREQEMQERPDGLAEKVKSPEGYGAYENKEAQSGVSTQL